MILLGTGGDWALPCPLRQTRVAQSPWEQSKCRTCVLRGLRCPRCVCHVTHLDPGCSAGRHGHQPVHGHLPQGRSSEVILSSLQERDRLWQLFKVFQRSRSPSSFI